jgi:hypothetical protein
MKEKHYELSPSRKESNTAMNGCVCRFQASLCCLDRKMCPHVGSAPTAMVPSKLHHLTSLTDPCLSVPAVAVCSRSVGDAAAVSLLQAAAGLQPATISSSRSSSSGGSSSAAAVLDVFDILAPSIRLPPAVLAHFVSQKPVLAWTLEKVSDVRKAMWLGLDVGISNAPVQQAEYVGENAGLCDASGRDR